MARVDFGICIHPSALKVCGNFVAIDPILSCDIVSHCVIVGHVTEFSVGASFARVEGKPLRGFVVLSLMVLITSSRVGDSAHVLTSICCQTLREQKEL